MKKVALLPFVLLFVACILNAQSTSANITGRITDPTRAVIGGAKITLLNTDTNIAYSSSTDQAGSYHVTNIPPGNYRMELVKQGFRTVIKPAIVLHVQDALELNFEMAVGATSESVTVEGGAPLVNTQDATVSTVIDRNFAENLPMNGRSFQTLIQLTPGVVLTSSNVQDSGQFSVNGQRASANYWMVDGVSANIGIGGGVSQNPGTGLAGSQGSFSALGGTNSLVSVDALQEFRIQTSTYAPEFGRTPGGQISIVTRSGANQFHGTLFEYFRNDVLDANDWFADNKGLKKPKERQNDFGGTFSGPVIKDRTFFFFSYEGLRLRLPQVALTTVPDLSARQNAVLAMQPYLNAFPLPNGPDNAATGAAQFNSSFSNSSTLDAYSLRVDHNITDKISVFGRYNYSPSQILQRGSLSALSALLPIQVTTQTATVGLNWAISPLLVNDLRFNYSQTSSLTQSSLDSFGGAVPLTSLPFPSPFNAGNSSFSFSISSLSNGRLQDGYINQDRQHQINLVDGVSAQKGLHSLKFGIDFRRLSPLFSPDQYGQQVAFRTVPPAQTGTLFFSNLQSYKPATLYFHNLGVYAQDTWRASSRLTLTYGLRWDVDFAPSVSDGLSLQAVTGYNINDLSHLALAPAGTPPFYTPYGSVAPRIGIAYQLSQSASLGTVIRGGFGVFYDLASSEVGNVINDAYPFRAFHFTLGGTFPLSAAAAASPPLVPPGLSAALFAFDPHLQLPYTRQWNIALEQLLGRQQSLSISYLGSAGRQLIQSADVNSPNPNYSSAILIGNSSTSDYDALQLQFQRRLSHGLQAIMSYTWSHSIDTGSAGSYSGNFSNDVATLTNPETNRGPSDFDIRGAFTAGITYNVPVPQLGGFVKAILGNWSTENVVQARSAPPVDVYSSQFRQLSTGYVLNIRPDVVSGAALYLSGAQYPGGKAINPGAFTTPPTDAKGNPLRQGSLGRNGLRGFGAAQWDFALHRDLRIRESLKLQFRAELFNVLNHPNFGQPIGDLFNAQQFGRSTQMLGQSLGGGNLGTGGFSPLYQIGGPRSVQFALKLQF